MKNNTHNNLEAVRAATQRKQKGEAGKAFGRPLADLSDDVLQNWHTVRTFWNYITASELTCTGYNHISALAQACNMFAS